MISNFFSWLFFLFQRRIARSGYVTETSTPSFPIRNYTVPEQSAIRTLRFLRYHSFIQPLWLMRKSKQTTRPQKHINKRRYAMR